MRTATEREIEFINKHRALGNLQAEDVYVQAFLLSNTSFISKYSMFFHPRAVKQMADTAGMKDSKGVNFKVMHDRSKVVSLGKSFAGAYDDQAASSYGKFYFPRGHAENGYTTDDLVRGIESGVYAATSFGLSWPKKAKSVKCSLCGGNPLWFRRYFGGDGEWCGHWPGDKYKVTEAMADFIKKMKTEGMDSYPGETVKVDDEIQCRMWLMDTEGNFDELSVVDSGASDSEPVDEDTIPVKFSVAKDHPAFKLATDKGDDNSVRELLGSNLKMTVDTELTTTELADESIKLNSDEVIELLSEQEPIVQGGDYTVKDLFKGIFKKGLKATVEAEGGDETIEKIASSMLGDDGDQLKEIVTALTASGWDGKQPVADFLKANVTETEKKYNTIPEDIRTKIEDTTLTWDILLDYVKVCQKELDGVCTDLCNAAVAAKGDEAKVEDLKAEIMTKARAFGLEAAIDHGRKMIKAYQDSQTLKPGQKTTAADADKDEKTLQAEKETALRTFARENLKKMGMKISEN